MKNIYLILIVLLSNTIKSQTIINITDSEMGLPNGYYAKDLDNLLDPFQGTYIYNNGNTSFKIVLTKMIMQPVGSHFEDMIIGEYQYIENGIEKINTLSNLNVNYPNQFLKHNIASKYIIKNINSRLWKCPQCNSNEKRLAADLEDKISGRSADFLMRRTIINGQEVMQVMIQHISSDPIVVGSSVPAQPEFSLPTDEFIMTKQ